MRSRFKKWALPFIEEHEEITLSLPFEDKTFFENAPLYLEIGSGKGDFIVSLAERHPENHYLAVERDVSSLGTLAKKIVEKELKNVKIVYQDFDKAAPELPKEGFKTIYLNFSDPWPKKRHSKRRLTAKPRLETYLSLLEKGGELRQKTDNEGLYEFTKEEVEGTAFINLVDEKDYVFDEENDAMSEYERNFRSEGKPIYRLIYKK